MAVPAHDERDFEFAKKFDISIQQSVTNKEQNIDVQESAYTVDGILINS